MPDKKKNPAPPDYRSHFRICAFCAGLFKPAFRGQIYCSEQCRYQAHGFAPAKKLTPEPPEKESQ